MIVKGKLPFPISDSLIGFDAEWTKNYKIKNGNVPFCFSIVAVKRKSITMEHLVNGNIQFEYMQFYCENKEETVDLIKNANIYAGYICDSLDTCILCGHQVSSDYSVLVNMGIARNICDLDNLNKLQEIWHKRKSETKIRMVDTRYDINRGFMGKSRRLVDMCNDFFMDVRQPELNNTSMTKLQNQFYDRGDFVFYERIAVMNLRHSLSAVLLYWMNDQIKDKSQLTSVNINRIVYGNLEKDFEWIHSDIFGQLL